MNHTHAFAMAARNAALALPLAALIGCAGPGPGADQPLDRARAEASAEAMPVVVPQPQSAPEPMRSAQEEPSAAKTPPDADAAAAPSPAAPNAPETTAAAQSELGPGEPAQEAPQPSVAAAEPRPEPQVLYFDSDASTVRAADEALIEAHAAYLAAHPQARVRLEGHSDPRGPAQYNRQLSERRAQEVARLLIAHGAAAEQVDVAALGEDAARGEAGALQANRRVDLDYAGAPAASLLSRN